MSSLAQVITTLAPRARRPDSSSAMAGQSVLLVQEHAGDARQVRAALEAAGYSVHHVPRFERAVESLHARTYQVIVLDIDVGEGRGVEIIERLQSAGPQAPIIALTSSTDSRGAIRALQSGAQDVLLKSRLDRESLSRSVGYAVERTRAAARLSHLAHYDQLTGLANRTLFTERLDHALARSRRSKDRVAVLFLDLDRFKEVNDTLGHEAGDCVLRELAKRLRGAVRDCETVARIGGDELTVILEPIRRVEDAQNVAKRILDAMAQPFELDGCRRMLTVSIGVGVSADGDTSVTLLERADRAMYAAKRGGRNTVEIQTEDPDLITGDLFDISCEVERALLEGELELHYQPRQDLRTGKVTGAEALLRWNHPRRGHLLPADFIAHLEDSGFIVEVGDWVIAQALRQARQWREAGLDLQVAVNLSVRQFEQPNLKKRIVELLAEQNLPPSCLEIEITESILMENNERTRKTLSELRALGITITVDDFGTGYSSLSYLTDFPIDTLKIDRSFTQAIATSERSHAVLEAILHLGRRLGIHTVAEGIETVAQQVALTELGCEVGQGYLFCRPLCSTAVTTFLLASNG
jgi:diguanylate cyclase